MPQPRTESELRDDLRRALALPPGDERRRAVGAARQAIRAIQHRSTMGGAARLSLRAR